MPPSKTDGAAKRCSWRCVAVGSAGVQNANPIALDAVIESLRRLGLDKDARRLAIEAAVGAGI